jgi:ribosome-associated toxin RatA of RatAB toxin-antitoxin module
MRSSRTSAWFALVQALNFDHNFVHAFLIAVTLRMRTIHRSALVSHTPREMFELVNNIEAYPQFLPWCSDARVLARDDQQIRAQLKLAKRGMETSFTTLNLLQRDRQVEMRLLEGPFRKLQGLWRFEPVDASACRVSLDMAFELSSKIMALTLGPVFEEAANHLVDAFLGRADEVYGGM